MQIEGIGALVSGGTSGPGAAATRRGERPARASEIGETPTPDGETIRPDGAIRMASR